MAQNYIIDCYASGHNGREDLQLYENNFECLRSFFSGTSAPSIATAAGQIWFDISTSTEILKMRNYNNSSWIGIMTGDTTHKMWVYANSAKNGWTLSSSPPTDCILALKTDSGGNDYEYNAGNLKGSWTQPPYPLIEDETPIHNHGLAGDHTHNAPGVTGYKDGHGSALDYPFEHTTVGNTTSNGDHTHSVVGGNSAHNHGSTYRPYAAVGTMQNLNI